MQAVLTGWKEIADYVRKGVRTVQRWERNFAFPVRRATNGAHHSVLALPEEIDGWVQRQSGSKKSVELQQCEGEVARLKDELERSHHHGAS